jgi:predicted nucleotidyltransferase
MLKKYVKLKETLMSNDILEKIDSFLTLNKTLNPDLWEDDKLIPEVKDHLMMIVGEFIKFLKVEITPLDVIFTGSNAAYNYTPESDIDLHIVTDFSKINGDINLIKEFFMAKKSIWNENRDIKVKGHDVELYVQDKDEELIASGKYSVMNDEWIIKPDKKVVDEKSIDNETINKKVNQFHYDINNAVEDGNLTKLNKIKDKIKTLRKSGLHKAGEFGVENLTFKALRNDGSIEKLMNGINASYDKKLSLEEIEGLNMSGSYPSYSNIG